MDETLKFFSVIIPARNEEACIVRAVRNLDAELNAANIPHEIIVVDDHSADQTWQNLQAANIDSLKLVKNEGKEGFGRAIVCGLDAMRGDATAVMMADESDSPKDAVKYWQKLNEGYDCAFGSRFIKGSRVENYPFFKLILNRLANSFLQILFRISLNDTTNAFKAYRREVIEGCRPFLSPHFNLTIEIPLKAIVRGYSWAVLPIEWKGRTDGASKFKIKEMGSRYLFICLYVWLEKYFSRGDYRKNCL